MNVAEVPPSDLEKIFENSFWEADDGGAHLKVTRHPIPGMESREFISLSVSGSKEERKRVISEFVEAIGAPVQQDTEPGENPIEFVLWVVPAGGTSSQSPSGQ